MYSIIGFKAIAFYLYVGITLTCVRAKISFLKPNVRTRKIGKPKFSTPVTV